MGDEKRIERAAEEARMLEAERRKLSAGIPLDEKIRRELDEQEARGRHTEDESKKNRAKSAESVRELTRSSGGEEKLKSEKKKPTGAEIAHNMEMRRQVSEKVEAKKKRLEAEEAK